MKETKKVNLLLLGASGAGKSSFAKTFLLHSSNINSTNDGQTTRSNIIYDLSLYEEKPSIEIKFLNKENFVTRMIRLNYANYLLKIVNMIDGRNSISTLEEYLFDKLLDIQDYTNNGENIKEEAMLIKENLFKIDEDWEKNIERYGKICDLVEEKIKKELACNDKNKEQNKIPDFIKGKASCLNETLSKVEGFFDIKEFECFFDEFVSKDIFSKESIEILVEDDETFYGYFGKYYREVYEKIIQILRDMNIVKGKYYSWKTSLNDKEKSSEIVTYCLQVKDKKSLTGLVDYGHIKDSISNEYSFIMDDLGISNLKLFDTYGLDHAGWDGDKGKILTDVLYDLQEKKILYFNSDLAVVYIKKMDSGKPTELKSIIPQIYKMIPQSPIYCVFNGLDIFLGNEIDTFTDMDYLSERQKKPKAIEYIADKDGDKKYRLKNDIKKIVGENNKFLDYLYETLKNNIVTFCSNDLVLKEKFNILIHNRKEIYKLLISICMKEYSSLNIIPKKLIGKIDKGSYDEEIKKIMRDIFKNASKTNWDSEHHMTREANYGRIYRGEKLGYHGTYQHKWNQLFHQGYVKTVTQMESNFLGVEDVNYAYAIDACIKNMEELFLGPAYQLANKEFSNEYEEKKRFRNLIEKMYERGINKVYHYNPLLSENKGENKEENKENKVKIQVQYLNNVCNFLSGYDLIEKELLEHFKKCLKKVIGQENKEKSENLIKVNYEFYYQLEKLKHDFKTKYEEVELSDLYDLLNYYNQNTEN